MLHRRTGADGHVTREAHETGSERPNHLRPRGPRFFYVFVRGRRPSLEIAIRGHREHVLCWKIDGAPLNVLLFRLCVRNRNVCHIDEGVGAAEEVARWTNPTTRAPGPSLM